MQLIEQEEDVEIIRKAKMALALHKTLDLLFDARYILKNHGKKFGVKLSELNASAEVIKRLLVEKYDPQFDLKKEEKEEAKTLKWHWGEHVPGLKQFSSWAFKRWFTRASALARYVETLPPGEARKEIIEALVLINRVMEDLGLTSLRPQLNRFTASEALETPSPHTTEP